MFDSSLVVAAKFHDDFFYNNTYFAKLGGIPLAELNSLEVEFLTLHEYSMFVNDEVFTHYEQQLRNCQHLVHASPLRAVSPTTVYFDGYGSPTMTSPCVYPLSAEMMQPVLVFPSIPHAHPSTLSSTSTSTSVSYVSYPTEYIKPHPFPAPAVFAPVMTVMMEPVPIPYPSHTVNYQAPVPLAAAPAPMSAYAVSSMYPTTSMTWLQDFTGRQLMMPVAF